LSVLDPKVVTNGDHFLAHLVLVPATTWTTQLAIILPLIAAVLTISS
jgi:hypothetical protein